MEISNEIMETLEWSTYPELPKGGQMAGIPRRGVTLKSKEMGFEISTDAFRSQIQAKQFCMNAFKLFLQELRVVS